MKNLPKDKKNRLIAVVAITVVALGGIWYGPIRLQQKKLEIIAVKRAAAERKRDFMQKTIQSAGRIETSLADASKKLNEFESGMASGDLYSWVINTIRDFKSPYKVEIPQFTQIDGPKDMTMLPNFPYQQATLTVAGTAYFHDFGRFVADFENQFPYFRVLNLNLEPLSGGPTAVDHEKLSFKMDLSVLVKPNAS
ncbi:MAG: hypothetical protein C5B50_00590 [Verrucomicrobia bacterium]|nr:MAG: hypothetical protein C5B50_00590 [Verrucomicrobiota bacterium]